MSKNKFQGHPPRPTKTELHKAAQEQHKRDETRFTNADNSVSVVVKEPELAKGQEESTVSTAPPPKAEETPAPAPTPAKTDAATLYALGKKYAPKTDRNSGTWAILTKALSEGPKTMNELAELVKGHKDFLGYMTRGGHIVPHVAKEMVEAAAAN